VQLTGTRRAEIAMGLVAIAIAAAFLFDGRDLRPGVLEPVGPGTIPNATCWIVIALALAMLVRTVWGGGEPPGAAIDAERWRDLAVLVVATCAYVAVLGFGLLRYNIATAAFLLATILWLAENRRSALPAAIAIALVLGFGLDYIFRHVLVTDLP
jgi:Tripartite tricarboxylate transporter TctB family